MLTLEQKEAIRKCYESYSSWGEKAPNWFTCEMLLESDFKYLSFGDVYGYIHELDTVHFIRWQEIVTRRANERKKKEELEKLKEEEAKRNVKQSKTN